VTGRPRALLFPGTLTLVIAGSACDAISGLGGLHFDRDGAAGSGAGSLGSGGHGGSSSSGPVCAGDCADPSCVAAGYQCVAAAAPGGWLGPVILYDSVPTGAPQDCPPAFPQKVYQGVRGPNFGAACTSCACGGFDASCTLGLIQQFISPTTCPTTPISPAPQGSPNTCNGINIGDPMGGTTFLVQPPKVMVTCTPTGGQPVLSAPPWDAVGFACGGPTAGPGCDGGAACLPPPPAPFLLRACVYQTGVQPCPAGYPEEHAFWGISDTRGCTPCTCSADPQTTCSATTTLYPDGMCTLTPLQTHKDDGTCSGFVGLAKGVMATTQIGGPKTCASAGGQPTGTIGQDNNPTTFCCTAP
jgi:hypothetical protein